jgi:hypothetical protein
MLPVARAKPDLGAKPKTESEDEARVGTVADDVGIRRCPPFLPPYFT